MISQQEDLDALDAAGDETSSPSGLEERATRLELLAEANDARRTAADDFLTDLFGTDETPGRRLRELAANLRRAPEWRAERRAEWERTKPSPRVIEAGAIAAGCWADEPVEQRLRRVEDALRRLGDLAEQARAEDAFEDATAIGAYASSVYKLRGALGGTTGDEGSEC